MKPKLGPPRRWQILWRVFLQQWDSFRAWTEEAGSDHQTGYWYLRARPAFHGRLYAGRSDLSADGSLLIYFAGQFNKRTVSDTEYAQAWTTISRPPFLTALGA